MNGMKASVVSLPAPLDPVWQRVLPQRTPEQQAEWTRLDDLIQATTDARQLTALFAARDAVGRGVTPTGDRAPAPVAVPRDMLANKTVSAPSSAKPAPKATTPAALIVAARLNTRSVWDTYIARMAAKTGRPALELDREESQRVLDKLARDRKARLLGGK